MGLWEVLRLALAAWPGLPPVWVAPQPAPARGSDSSLPHMLCQLQARL
jgi:hypothetical protein